MPLEVIGAGFGRTGTQSLKIALEMLGFGRCHHMVEAFESKEQADLWMEAVERGNRGSDFPDSDFRDVDALGTDILDIDFWDSLFAGYRAAVDWPSTWFYRQLAEVYPRAKVILTVRDADDWYQSIKKTIFNLMDLIEGVPDITGKSAIGRKIIVDLTFEGRHNDPEFAKAVYENHIKVVQETIPPERLLVYEVSEGWEPLCAFLEVEVPPEEFPRVNTVKEFNRLYFPRARLPLILLLKIMNFFRSVRPKTRSGHAYKTY